MNNVIPTLPAPSSTSMATTEENTRRETANSAMSQIKPAEEIPKTINFKVNFMQKKTLTAVQIDDQ